jgi:hypothetical protein
MKDLLKSLEKKTWGLSFQHGEVFGVSGPPWPVENLKLVPLASYEILERMFLKACEQRDEMAARFDSSVPLNPILSGEKLDHYDAELRALAEGEGG